NAGGTISGSFSATSVTINIGSVSSASPHRPPPPPPFSLTDPLFVDLSTGASLKLTTTENILVLDLSRGSRGSVWLRAGTAIAAEHRTGFEPALSGIAASQCDEATGQITPLDRPRAGVVTLPAAYRNLNLGAGGEIMYLVPRHDPTVKCRSAQIAAAGTF